MPDAEWGVSLSHVLSSSRKRVVCPDGHTTRSGRYHPTAGLDPERLKGAEKPLVMAADGEAGAGNHAWPPALSDEEITNTRHAIAHYVIEVTTAAPAERQ